MIMKRNTRCLFWSVSAVALASVGIFACKPSKPKIMAKVGDYEITQKWVEFRNKVIVIYFPKETRKLGLDQLIRAYTTAQILKNNGHPVTEEILEAENRRIDMNTKMPELLDKIKDAAGGDKETYFKGYILPTYTERVIQDFFLGRHDLQERSYQKAKEFLAEALKNKDGLKGAVKGNEDLKVVPFVVSLRRGILWGPPSSSEADKEEEEKPGGIVDLTKKPPEAAKIEEYLNKQRKSQESEEAKRWIHDVIRDLKPGQVHPQVIDQREYWQVVRYVKRLRRGEYEMQSVSFPKSNFGNWMEEERAKVKVVRFD